MENGFLSNFIESLRIFDIDEYDSDFLKTDCDN
jgi:hypothetical protein